MKYLKLEFCKKTVDFFGTIGRLCKTENKIKKIHFLYVN